MGSQRPSWAKNPKQRWVILLPLSLGMLSGLCTYSGQNDGYIKYTDPLLYAFIVAFASAYCLCFLAALFLIGQRNGAHCSKARLQTKQAPTIRIPRKKLLELSWSQKSILQASLIIAIGWLPYIIAYAPGTYWFDTSTELIEFYTGAVIDRHPFFVTLLFGLFSKIGRLLFASEMYGLFLLQLVQIALIVIALACSICYLSKFSVSHRAKLILLAFFAIFPFYPCIFTSLAKDTLFAPFFVFFALQLVEITRSRGGYIKSPVHVVLLLCVVLLMSLTRKTGIYIASLSLLFALLCVLGRRQRLALFSYTAFAALLVLVAVPKLAFPAFGIERGPSSEMLSVPLEQIANVVRTHSDSLTAEDAQAIEILYQRSPEKLQEDYAYYVADPIKGLSLEGRYKILAKQWLSFAMRYPADMLTGWLDLVGSWFAFDQEDSVFAPSYLVANETSAHHDTAVDAYADWNRASTSTGEAIGSFYNNFLIRIPVVGILFSKPLWASIIPFFLLFAILLSFNDKKKECLIALMPLWITILTLWVGPTSAYQEAVRYVLPLVCVVPLYLAGTISICQRSERKL